MATKKNTIADVYDDDEWGENEIKKINYESPIMFRLLFKTKL